MIFLSFIFVTHGDLDLYNFQHAVRYLYTVTVEGIVPCSLVEQLGTNGLICGQAVPGLTAIR
jgi:hypothetical protein